MFSTLKNALAYIHLGLHEWKVQQYLNNATTGQCWLRVCIS